MVVEKQPLKTDIHTDKGHRVYTYRDKGRTDIHQRRRTDIHQTKDRQAAETKGRHTPDKGQTDTRDEGQTYNRDKVQTYIQRHRTDKHTKTKDRQT